MGVGVGVGVGEPRRSTNQLVAPRAVRTALSREAWQAITVYQG